jgi:GT2 family glycosyltransferase
MKLGIVVLNWNGKDVTPRCLDSIFHSSSAPDAVVVVDNASADGSVELIRTRYPQVVLFENDRNLGFAEGCNIGIRHLLDRDFDLVLLLNNDAEVDPGCLHALKQAAESYPAAAYTATIYEHGNRRKVWYGGGTISRLTLEARHIIQPADDSTSPRPTEFITGCCLMFRSEALERIGLLDTNFFAYYEDLDWCLRAKALGSRLLYVPNAAVYHEVSHSFRRTGSNKDLASRFSWAQKRPVVLYLTYRNRLLLARKQARSFTHFLFLAFRCLMRATLHAGILFAIGQRQRANAAASGALDGLRRMPSPPRIERYLQSPATKAT